MGCPPGHFHEYKYIGTELARDGLDYTRMEYNEKADLYVKVGFYYEFIEQKEKGLAIVIKANPDFDLTKESIIKEVKSSIFGKLNKKESLPYTTRVYDTINTLMYSLKIEECKERKTLKKIENDTISIELTNGKKLLFVRQTE